MRGSGPLATGLAVGLGLLLTACGSYPLRPAIERGEFSAPSSTRSSASATQPGARAATSKVAVGLKRGGGFYQDDGPGDNPPTTETLDAIPDAVPKYELLNRFTNKPYSVLGRDYVPLTSLSPYRAQGTASWYGRKFHGQKTSSGEAYDMYAMTAAHTTLPIPSYARVTNLANGRSVIVRVNDRGPFHSDRIMDLSYAAAWKLGYVGDGSTLVDVESVLPGSVPPEKPSAPSPEAGDALAGLLDRIGQTKETESPAGAPPATENVRGIFLQLGAFGNPDNAESLKAHLGRELASQPATAEYSDKLIVVARAGVYRVQLGPWSDRTQAERAAERLREVFEARPVIVQQ